MATSGRGVVGWAARMDRFSACGMTVMDFCRAEGVSQSSYYLWRARLASGSAPLSKLAPTGTAGRDFALLPSPPLSAQTEFVDLGTYGRAAAPSGRLELRLDLGDGLVLTLVRG